MTMITYVIIMCIIGYFLKDLLMVLLLGLLVFIIMQNGLDVVPLAADHLVNFIDSVRGAL